MSLGENLRAARKRAGFTQKQLAELIGAKHNSISNWENNQNKPDPDTIEIICGVLNISPNQLLETRSSDNTKTPTPGLSAADERDIARDLERLKADLESADSLMFDGNPMSDEARESILAAMKLGLEAAKIKNKETYTPKKYRKG